MDRVCDPRKVVGDTVAGQRDPKALVIKGQYLLAKLVAGSGAAALKDHRQQNKRDGFGRLRLHFPAPRNEWRFCRSSLQRRCDGVFGYRFAFAPNPPPEAEPRAESEAAA